MIVILIWKLFYKDLIENKKNISSNMMQMKLYLTLLKLYLKHIYKITELKPIMKIAMLISRWRFRKLATITNNNVHF